MILTPCGDCGGENDTGFVRCAPCRIKWALEAKHDSVSKAELLHFVNHPPKGCPLDAFKNVGKLLDARRNEATSYVSTDHAT